MESFCAREGACSNSDPQCSNFKSCVWRAVSSHLSHHPQEVLLALFSLSVHKGGRYFHFILLLNCRVHYVNSYSFVDISWGNCKPYIFKALISTESKKTMFPFFLNSLWQPSWVFKMPGMESLFLRYFLLLMNLESWS